MKKIVIIIWLLIPHAALATDLIFLTHSCEMQTKIDEKGELRGIEHAGKRAFYVELIREMMTLMEVTKKIEQVPLIRGMKCVQERDNIAFFNVSRIPEREDSVKWVGPILVEADYFYEMKNAPTGITNLEDAKKVKKIGVVRGGVHEKILLNNGFTNTYPVTEYLQTYRMLNAGRVNLVPATAGEAFESTLKKVGIPRDKIQKTPVLVLETGGYLVFSKNISDDVILQWQDALDRIKESGKYQQIYNLYILP
ncbi:substrate-binding periplasmic protein [Desulforegula conservatrix]|uniref:substrate-binding periplasmic protein n=1 Tax=Desulforegula conservatrix TaxID=153026 RepID=UPI000421F324|nr:ABC transporter substrate-binding protein [Desulforegula conservatrix]